jgi:acetylglutamate kinase
VSHRATTLVKLGGSLLEDAALRAAALAAIARRVQAGDALVVVHGGGKRIDRDLAARGIPKRTHDGLRVTDEATLEVVVAALAGTVNKQLVLELAGHGVRAAGLSGADGGTVTAERHPAIDGVDLGHVGRVTGTRADALRALMQAGLLPVVAALAIGPEGLLNVNADEAAAALAAGVGARRLVFLTDVEGVKDAHGRLLDRIDAAGAQALLASPAVQGGMRPKLRACLSALAAGVEEVVIAGPLSHGSVLAGGPGGSRLTEGGA